ncbi:carbohydrate ABC transporter permease [Clostridium grantii]|uniref:Multiple sugar transport system permease protein n=1 Tax=Clostridium grantii DSM 8605 TaxID=1121316 RepID=A0A1M5T2M1_9CLOT|nr:sugar ABC transporter permease [Clostridium grantii]SHH45054.1 multiple sugar transport system permease protein [Clostridium grantii DSM 8605]
MATKSLSSKKEGKRKTISYSKYGYFFVAPFIIAFLIFQFYPILYTINLSFTDLAGWAEEFNYVGFKNYTSLLNNKLFHAAFINTWIIWMMNFIPQITLALLLASWFTNLKLKIKGTGFFKVTLYLPNIITAASVSVLFYAIFGYPSGPLNQLMQNMGLIDAPINFFRSVGITRGTVAFIQFWMWYGNTMIILMAAILGISPSLYESAMVDGATSTQMFWRITMPLIKPIMLYTLITSLIGGMQMFDIPFLLTGGAPNNSVQTMTMFIYKQAFTGGRNFYFAAAASMLLFILIAVISLIIFRFFRQEDRGRA